MNQKEEKINELLLDNRFVDWLINPQSPYAEYWFQWIKADPGHAALAEQAKVFLLELRMTEAILEKEISEQDTAGIWDHIRESIGPDTAPVVMQRAFRRWYWVAAAAFTGLVLLSATLFINRPARSSSLAGATKENQPPAELVRYNGSEKNELFFLPDGSKITLAKDARISYNRLMSGNKREVYLTGEAFFLARLVAEMMPGEPEAIGLLALMLHAEARRGARRSEDGEYVPLAKQDPLRWNSQMIDEAEALLVRASGFGVTGRYQLEAAVQSAHVYRCRTGHPNWEAVLHIYDALFTITGSPVVAINRALALAELYDAHAGLEAMPDHSGDGRLAEYQPYWAARAELLAKAGAHEEAGQAYEVAIGLERDPAVRRFLERRHSGVLAGMR